MGSGLQAGDSMMIAAFRQALVHQGIIIAVVCALLAVAWISAHDWLPSAHPVDGRARPGGRPAHAAPPAPQAEPTARRVLRIGFGILWIIDGLLQVQPAMPVRLAWQVVLPAAASSPPWVQHLVSWGANTWTYHPITAAASVVWIQIGIGAWLVVATRGAWSWLAGLASLAWGMVVWVFGEAFGGVFGHGLTWFFGAPGAALLYCVAGALIALPVRAWSTRHLGGRVLAASGLFFIGMAVLQAWPGRGFWQGRLHGRPGTLTGMIQDMSRVPQPRFLAASVSAFGSFVAAHGFAVNLFAVIALAAIGAGLLSGRPRLLRLSLVATIVLCLADWVLIEDLGVFGGVGTDPNSMIPMALLALAGYLALAPAPAAATGQAQPTAASPGNSWRHGINAARLHQSISSASPGSMTAVGALAMVALGALPMAAASANHHADPIIAQAIAGPSRPLNYPAPPFQLTDQHGTPVTLASLRGKAVLLTFLDPTCASDCRPVAQEFRGAGQLLGAQSRRVELVAVVANPIYRSSAFTRAFDRQERLDKVANWRYLTGTLRQLTRVWNAYGVTVSATPAGAVDGDNVAFVIDARGRIRRKIDPGPGPGTASSKSSFAVLLANAAEDALRSS